MAAGPVIERFSPPAGRILGYVAATVGLGMAATAVTSGVAANRGLVFFGIATACLAWVALIRPVVAAHEHGLVLRNMVRDVFVPWARIERTRALQTLRVVTSDATYHGLGVSRSARSVMKEARRGSGPSTPLFGIGGGLFSRETPRPNEPLSVQRSNVSYSAYVEWRLQDLAARYAGNPNSGRPLVSWAALPLVALLVALACIGLVFV